MSVAQPAERSQVGGATTGAMRVARNALAQAGSQMLLTPINLGFVMLVARTLGPEEYGVFQLSQSFPALVAAAIPLGMNVYFSRDLAQRPRDAARYAELGFGLALVSGVLGYLVLQVAASAMGFSDEVRSVVIVSGVVAVLSAVATLTGSFFRAFERLQLDALLVSGERLVGIAVGVGAILIWQSPLALIVALLVASLGRLLISQVVLRRTIGSFGIRLSGAESLGFVRTGWPFLLAGYCTNFNDNIGLSVLGGVGTPAEVGTYAAAWRLVVFGTIVALAFANATLPMLARAAAGSRDRVQAITATVLPGLAFVSGAGASLAAILSVPLVTVIYGERFGEVPALVANLLLVLPALCLLYFTGNALMSMGEQPFITRLQVLVAIVGLGLNVLLARALGAVGTGAAMLIVDHAICLGYLLRLRQVDGCRDLRPVILAWCAGVIPGLLAAHLAIPVLAQLLIALVGFGVVGLLAREYVLGYVQSLRLRLGA